MKVIERIHAAHIQERRVTVLCRELAGLFPERSTILDVGSGDGWLAYLIQQKRPDLQLHGVDVLLREKNHIPVKVFDGKRIPAEDKTYDFVMFVDVLHHTEDPMILLREALRVARHGVVIKDHTCDGFLAFQTLKFMDDVGNRRFGVALPHNYWTEKRWRESFEQLHLRTGAWRTRLGLYPLPLRFLFERKLHFIARLEIDHAMVNGRQEQVSGAVVGAT